MYASTALVTLFAAAAAALPASRAEIARDYSYENVDISDFTVRKDQAPGTKVKDAKISSVSFKLSGKDAKDLLCEARNPTTEVVTCGDSDYRFALTHGTPIDEFEFALSLYHQTAPAAGLYATGNVPTYCHAGGDGPNDFVCSQVGQVTIVIDNGAEPPSE